MDATEGTMPRVSLINTALAGDVSSIGRLISAGAMVNERDKEGYTLLHLIAMGNRVPNAYQVTLELERYGRHGIDHAAVVAGKTARHLAEDTLRRSELHESTRFELERIKAYLISPHLPLGYEYIFPCMDPRYCHRCGSLKCSCVGYDGPNFPGTFKS